MKVHIYSNVGNKKPEGSVQREPLGPLSLQAYLDRMNPGVFTEVYDAQVLGLGQREMLLRMLEEKPAIIGFSCFPGELKAVYSLLEKLEQERGKEYSPLRIIGGYLSNLDPKIAEPLLEHIDAMVVGEGEIPLSVLASQVQEGRLDLASVPNLIYPEGGKWVENSKVLTPKKDIPQIRREYLEKINGTAGNEGKGIAGIATSRGCREFCSFCTIHAFRLGKKMKETAGSIGRSLKDALWIGRDVGEILEEIKYVSKMGISRLDVVDDDFISTDPERAREILKGIKQMVDSGKINPINFWISTRADRIAKVEGGLISVDDEMLSMLYGAGCRSVFLGLESGSQAQLDGFHKKSSVIVNELALHAIIRSGMRPVAGFIMFSPLSSLEETCESMNFVERNGAWRYLTRPTNTLVAYGRSRIKEELEKEGLLGKPNEEGTVYSYEFLDENVELLAESASRWNEQEGADAFRRVALIKDSISDFRFFGREEGMELFEDYLELKRIEWEFVKESIGTSMKNVGKKREMKSKLLEEIRLRHAGRFDKTFGSVCKKSPKIQRGYETGATSKKQLCKVCR